VDDVKKNQAQRNQQAGHCLALQTNAVLFIKCCGVANVLEFDYVDAPPSRALLEALRELIILGACCRMTPASPPVRSRPLVRFLVCECCGVSRSEAHSVRP
jgi:HrpA-like RNA helicase